MKFTLYLLVFIVGCKYTESLSNYLETLSKESRVDEPDPAYSRPEDIVPEEYYGFTNPMANNWPGSKHEKYGAYLKKIETTRVGGSVAPAANSWRSETSTPKAQGHGSYLDSL